MAAQNERCALDYHAGSWADLWGDVNGVLELEAQGLAGSRVQVSESCAELCLRADSCLKLQLAHVGRRLAWSSGHMRMLTSTARAVGQPAATMRLAHQSTECKRQLRPCLFRLHMHECP